MKRTAELMALVNEKNTPQYNAIKKEVQFMQMVIVARRAEFPPGK